MTKAFAKAKLGDVLTRVARFEQRDEFTEYPFAGTYSFARGIFVGERKPGSSFALPKIQRIRTGDFVYCKIMAWEGAFGIVPKEADGCVMSGAFVAYEPDRTRIDERFLDYYFKVPDHWRSIGSQSTGTNVRRQSLHPRQFESSEIPLPPLTEQRRIVARIGQLAAQIHEARALRNIADAEAAALRARVSVRCLSGKAQSAPLANLIAEGTTISYGVLVPGPEVEDGVPFIRIQDLSVGNPPDRPSKRISHEVEKAYARTRLNGGEVLIAVVGATIGKVGVAPSSWRGANIARAVCRIVPGVRIERDFLVHVLQSADAQEYFRSSTRTLAQPTLNVGQLEQLPIPVPPIAEQRRIVSELNALQTQVDALKKLQNDTAVELDALLPSILDKAFKGEL